MKRTLTLTLFMVVFSVAAMAGDLNLTFDTDADVANWSHHDEGNVFTVEEWDATGGVGGSGALRLSDGGWGFLAKRAITATVGTNYELTVDIKVSGWDAGNLYLIVQGIGAADDSVEITGNTSYSTVTISGTAVAADGYIKIAGDRGATAADTVWVDNVLFDDNVASTAVTVHFNVNTAGVPDTLGVTSVLQVRGDTAPLSWDGNSGVLLTNVGASDEWGSSDYWTGSTQFPAGAVIQYKFYTNAHSSVTGGDPWEHQGWEGDLAGGNRVLDLTGFTGTDTTLDLQFVNGWQSGVSQYDAPYTTNDTTFVVYLRVNVEGFKQQGFDPAQHKIGVRGSNTTDWGQTGEISWGSTFFLTPENDHANGGSQQYPGSNFYSGAVHVPMQYANSGIQWKFVAHFLNSPADDDWGNLFWNPQLEENVQFSGSGNDTTLYWRWYDRFRPGTADLTDTVTVTFKADMSKAIANSGFTPGDTVIAISGWNLTGADIYRSVKLVKQGFTNIYAATDTVVATIGANFQYNYYIIKDGIEYREISFDFTDTQGGSSPEKRKVQITGNSVEVLDDSDDISSMRRKPSFRNLNNPNAIIKPPNKQTVYFNQSAAPNTVPSRWPFTCWNGS